MRIRAKEDVTVSLTSAKSRSFRKGVTYDDVPKAVAERLIEAKKAEVAPAASSASKE